MKSPLVKLIIRALVASVLICLILSIWVTFYEWKEDPAGIFRGENGTNWNFVFDTFNSWFWPSLISVAPIAVGLAVGIALLRRFAFKKKKDAQ
ncbi:hypothetical protein [Pelagicoccus mobilis]|uniref:Uncharacterized protein n=1 Tax=Pelagicoccus mobilis TaxID=415221 RepID=A0A934VT02_9BACT|nr:hypothetical protein [Pelagicoccus mobilis]MBK1879560.1 hypothetical protein [Pelagicoccus mobilis]